MLCRCALACLLLCVSSRAHAEPVRPGEPEARASDHVAPGQAPPPVAPELGADVTVEARRVHAEGLALFGQGRYAQAIERFRQAHALLPAPGLLYNIAQAERLSGHCEAAVREYRRFLELTPEGRASELARENLRELEPCAGPEPATPPVAPTEPAFPRTPTARRAATPSVKADAPSPQPPWMAPVLGTREREKPRKKSSKRLVASVSFGGAAALLALSGYFTWRSARASEHTTELFARGGRWGEADAAVERDGQRSEALALVSLASSAVAVGVGAWSLTFD